LYNYERPETNRKLSRGRDSKIREPQDSPLKIIASGEGERKIPIIRTAGRVADRALETETQNRVWCDVRGWRSVLRNVISKSKRCHLAEALQRREPPGGENVRDDGERSYLQGGASQPSSIVKIRLWQARAIVRRRKIRAKSVLDSQKEGQGADAHHRPDGRFSKTTVGKGEIPGKPLGGVQRKNNAAETLLETSPGAGLDGRLTMLLARLQCPAGREARGGAV